MKTTVKSTSFHITKAPLCRNREFYIFEAVVHVYRNTYEFNDDANYFLLLMCCANTKITWIWGEYPFLIVNVKTKQWLKLQQPLTLNMLPSTSIWMDVISHPYIVTRILTYNLNTSRGASIPSIIQTAGPIYFKALVLYRYRNQPAYGCPSV